MFYIGYLCKLILIYCIFYLFQLKRFADDDLARRIVFIFFTCYAIFIDNLAMETTKRNKINHKNIYQKGNNKIKGINIIKEYLTCIHIDYR